MTDVLMRVVQMKYLLIMGLAMIGMAGIAGWKERISNVELPNPNGSTNRYGVLLPKKVEEGKRYPLVLILHYGGKVVPFYGRSFMAQLVAPAYAKQDWVLVAPDCPGRGWSSPEAQDFIPKLLVHLATRYPINDTIILMGYSMGAHGVWYWTDKHPDRFAAAVAVSGSPYEQGLAENYKKTPIYVIHSREDELIPLKNTSAFVTRLKKQGVAVKFASVTDLRHYDVGGYAPHLRRTIPWLKKQLKK